MDYRCHHCDATLEAEPGRVGEWAECPACRGMILLAERAEGRPEAGPEHPVAIVFLGLAILSGTLGVLLFVLGVGREKTDVIVFAGVAIGCSLHFVFLWAVLHLLSRILGRLEQRSGSVSGQVGK